jgi:hypothetical protein
VLAPIENASPATAGKVNEGVRASCLRLRNIAQ